MKICDKCAANLVSKDMINPAGHFFPPNEIPWKKGVCPLCNKEDNLSEHPEIKSIQEDNVVIIKEPITLDSEEFNKRFK
jgi:hypothetical protein